MPAAAPVPVVAGSTAKKQWTIYVVVVMVVVVVVVMMVLGRIKKYVRRKESKTYDG